MGLGVSACSNMIINLASCIPSLSCLPFFYTIPIWLFFEIHIILNLYTCLRSILYTTTYISVKGGKPPIKIDNKEKCLLSLWKRCHMHLYQVSSPCLLPLASLRSEEVIFEENCPEAICCSSNKVVVMEMMLHACVSSFISMYGTVSGCTVCRGFALESFSFFVCLVCTASDMALVLERYICALPLPNVTSHCWSPLLMSPSENVKAGSKSTFVWYTGSNEKH